MRTIVKALPLLMYVIHNDTNVKVTTDGASSHPTNC